MCEEWHEIVREARSWKLRKNEERIRKEDEAIEGNKERGRGMGKRKETKGEEESVFILIVLFSEFSTSSKCSTDRIVLFTRR